MTDGSGATIREVHDLLDHMRDQIIEAVQQDQRSQMDFNMNIATRMEALSTRVSAHETMPSHQNFQSEMNRMASDVKEQIGHVRAEIVDTRSDLKNVTDRVTDLRLSYAKAAGVVLVLVTLITLAANVVPKLL